MADEKDGVLFLCVHNAARSQMAEALLRKHGAQRFQAYSAGLAPSEVHPLTREVLDEIGADTASLRAKGVKEFLGKARIKYAIVVCAEDEADCPRVFPMARTTLRWGFPDPVVAGDSPELALARFRRVRGDIEARIREWLRTDGVDPKADRWQDTRQG